MPAPARERGWPERARGGRHSPRPLLAARPSGFAGREVLGLNVMGRRCIGPSGAVSNQGPVVNLSRRRYGRCRLLSGPWLLLSAHALGDASLGPRASERNFRANASAIGNQVAKSTLPLRAKCMSCSYGDARIHAMIADYQPRITVLKSRLSHLENTIRDKEAKDYLLRNPRNSLGDIETLLLPEAQRSRQPEMWLRLVEFQLQWADRDLTYAEKMVKDYGPDLRVIGPNLNGGTF